MTDNYEYPLCLEEIKDLAYDLRDGKITLEEKEAILQKNKEWYERSEIMNKIDIVSDNYFNEEFNTSDMVKVFKDVYKKGFRRGVEKQKEVNNSSTIAVTPFVDNMNIFIVYPTEFDYLDGFRAAIVYAKDELHAERLVRVKNEGILPKKKQLKVEKFNFDGNERILVDDWFYG